MKRLCDWFDRYRDGEFDSEQRAEFERHAAACELCQTRSALLTSVVQAMAQQESGVPGLTPRQVAARAFERRAASWELALLSFVRPIHAWSAVAALVILVSFFVGLPWVRQPSASSDYAALTGLIEPAGSAQTLTDGQLERWLEQGGMIQ
jgi:anti-sigma factor RsiW